MNYTTLWLEQKQKFYQNKVTKMIKNVDQSVKIDYNPIWANIFDHLWRILFIGSSRSGKTNVLLNLLKKSTTRYLQMYSYVKDPF